MVICKKKYFYLVLSFVFSIVGSRLSAQETGEERLDNVIQLYGIIMTADSLRALPATSVIVEGKGRGTIANEEGIFSIAVEKGDHIRFSCVGYKDISISIPEKLSSKQYSVIQLMVEDTNYLPATILRPRPTPAQFERDFVNTDVPADMLEVARQNNNVAKLRILMEGLPMDGKEAYSAMMRRNTVQSYSRGQMPTMNILNPLAWADFIKAWKRGDFKK